MSRGVVVAALGILFVALLLAGRAMPESPGERIDRLTSDLRCPVCQGLSVRESPSETAREMRDLVVERALEAGCTPVLALVDSARPPAVAERLAAHVTLYAGGERLLELPVRDHERAEDADAVRVHARLQEQETPPRCLLGDE